MKSHLIKRRIPGLVTVLLICLSVTVFHSCRKDFALKSEISGLAEVINIDALKAVYHNDTLKSSLVTDAAGAERSTMLNNLNVLWANMFLLKRDSSRIMEFELEKGTDQWSAGTNSLSTKNKNSVVFIEYDGDKRLNFFMKVIEELPANNGPSVLADVHYNSIPKDFTGQVLFYSLDRVFINGWGYKTGSISTFIGPDKIAQPAAPTVNFTAKLKLDLVSVISYQVCYEAYNYNYTAGDPEHGVWVDSGYQICYTAYQISDTGGGGGGGSTGGGSTGGGGGVAGDGGSTTPPTNCPTTPPTAVASVNGTKITILKLDCPPTTPPPTTPTTPPTQQKPIDKLIKNPNALTAAQKLALQKVLDKILNDCIGQGTYNYMTSKGFTFDFTSSPNASYQAAYSPVNGNISVKDYNTLTSQALQEEFFHAYQNKNMPGGTTQYAGTTGSANIEFEAKVLRDMNALVNGMGGASAVPSKAYSDFIGSVTNQYTSLPTSFTSAQMTQYFSLMKDFIAANPGYSTNTIKPNLQPTAMFNLIKSSPCNI